MPLRIQLPEHRPPLANPLHHLLCKAALIMNVTRNGKSATFCLYTEKARETFCLILLTYDMLFCASSTYSTFQIWGTARQRKGQEKELPSCHTESTDFPFAPLLDAIRTSLPSSVFCFFGFVLLLSSGESRHS